MMLMNVRYWGGEGIYESAIRPTAFLKCHTTVQYYMQLITLHLCKGDIILSMPIERNVMLALMFFLP